MQRENDIRELMQRIEESRNDLVELCLELGNTPSPHGKELKAGEAVLAWLGACGIQGFLQHITEESINAVAIMRGSGDGKSLILNAHLDTGPELGPHASPEAKKIEGSWVEDELIFGKGVINDKAQLCAFMIACRALKQAGYRLKGDLTLTGVAFETGSPSVDDHQGINFPGEGFGTKWLVDRGVTADFALVGETSGFGIVKAECGAVWLKIRLKGRDLYTPRLERGATLREHPNALVKAAHVVTALDEWAIGYEKRGRLEFPGGTIIPKAQVVQQRYDEGSCTLYYDVRLPPEGNPRAIQNEIERLLRKLDLDFEVSVFQWSRGHIARNAEPLIAAVEQAHRQVFGSEPPAPPSQEVSMWRDLNVFNEVGIPSVCYGPPRQRETMSGGQNRAMKIGDLVSATKVYALTAINLCGAERSG